MPAFNLRRAGVLSVLLCSLGLPAWSAPAKPESLPEAAANTTLAEGLKTWNELTQRIQHLQTENAAWEMRFNPEREDRNWWNPFWRSAAERNLQQANELSLQIHVLETQRAALENSLLDTAQRLTQTQLAAKIKPASGERNLWQTVDAWRFPLWLQRLDEVKKSQENLQSLSPELQTRRRKSLEQHRQIALTLDAYLSWRRESESAGARAQLQTWQVQIQAWLASANSPR